MKRSLYSVLCAVALAAISVPSSLAADEIAQKIGTIVTGSVEVFPVERNGDSFSIYGQSGSGTLVDKKNKLILTNFHVINLEDKGVPAEYHAIQVTRAFDEVPEFAFIAKLVQYDEKLDLAVLKIEETLDSAPVAYEALYSFEWENAERWKSIAKVNPLDTIYALGYPGVGGKTVTITKGQVSGFIATDPDLTFKRQFIKSDVQLSFGNSGGTALDSSGRFIGVPTMVTNQQGGAVLGFIRACDLATPLIEAARSGAPMTGAPDKVVVTGKLFDVKTRKPVTGGLVIVLKPGVLPEFFLLSQDETLMAGYAQSNESGVYRISGLVPKTRYGVIALHESYRPSVGKNALTTGAAGECKLDIAMAPE